MSEANKSVVRRMVEDHWNRKDAALLGEVFAPSVSLRTPDGVLTGLDGASALLEAYATAFPDFHIVIQELLAEGDRVILQYKFTGTNRGPLAGMAATGRYVDTPPGIAIFRVERGKVVDGQFVWDKYALLEQLGLVTTAPGTAPVSA